MHNHIKLYLNRETKSNRTFQFWNVGVSHPTNSRSYVCESMEVWQYTRFKKLQYHQQHLSSASWQKMQLCLASKQVTSSKQGLGQIC